MLALILSQSAVLAPPPEAMTRSTGRPGSGLHDAEMARRRERDPFHRGSLQFG